MEASEAQKPYFGILFRLSSLFPCQLETRPADGSQPGRSQAQAVIWRHGTARHDTAPAGLSLKPSVSSH